jgi:glycosyltransferase involved in cell wall biosynthesis
MKLSVMVITYNHESYIAKTLASIVSQRVNFNYEIVVGEDHSTDKTREILLQFSQRYPGLIVPILRPHNIGAVPNFMATLGACRGEYVALLEGDDYWTREDKLQTQIDLLDANPELSMCCHRVQMVDQDGLAGNDVGEFPSLPAGLYSMEDLLKSNFVMTCSAVLRRGLIGTLPDWFSRMTLGDWPLFALVSRHGKVALLDEVLAAYRVHSAGIWSTRPAMFRLRETCRMLETLDEYLGFQYTKTIRNTLAGYYLDMAAMERENGNRTATGKCLFAYMRNRGWRLPPRAIAGLAAYTVMGSWYKVFSGQKTG